MYTIHFRNWYSPQGTDIHEVNTDVFDVKIDPLSITGVDYYKYESRRASFLLYNDSWLDTNLQNGINSSNQIGDMEFWKYAVIIKQDNITIYTGYLKRDNLKYDRQYGEYQITLLDFWAIMRHFGTQETEFDDNDYEFNNLLVNLVSNMKQSVGGYGWGVSYDPNYNFDTSMAVIDQQVFDGGSYANGGHSEWYWMPFSTLNHSVRAFRQNGNDIDVFYMKYWQRPDPNYMVGDSYATSREKIIWQKLTITNRIQIINYEYGGAQSTQIHYSEGTNTPDIIEAAYLATDPLYNAEWVDSDYPIADNTTYTDGDGFTWVMTGDKINYTGNLYFDYVNIVSDTYTLNSIMDMCLLVNNLTLNITAEGDILVRNKNAIDGSYSIETIDDEYIDNQSEQGIIKREPDYESIFRPLASFPIISSAIKTYYLELFATLNKELSCMIENEYDLNLGQQIVVDSNNYKISSILLDSDNYLYSIKAWSV